eukprot:359109-Chlamydomonas_euryale.AAC.1
MSRTFSTWTAVKPLVRARKLTCGRCALCTLKTTTTLAYAHASPHEQARLQGGLPSRPPACSCMWPRCVHAWGPCDRITVPRSALQLLHRWRTCAAPITVTKTLPGRGVGSAMLELGF